MAGFRYLCNTTSSSSSKNRILRSMWLLPTLSLFHNFSQNHYCSWNQCQQFVILCSTKKYVSPILPLYNFNFSNVYSVFSCTPKIQLLPAFLGQGILSLDVLHNCEALPFTSDFKNIDKQFPANKTSQNVI